MATRGWESVTAADIAAKVAKVAKRPSKYRNVKTTLDGIEFDSKKEAARYQQLRAMERTGLISDLRWQTPYPLIVNGTQVAVYRCDFEYEEPSAAPTWVAPTLLRVVEDVKSPATRKKELYRLKRKMFEAQYGIEIRET